MVTVKSKQSLSEALQALGSGRAICADGGAPATGRGWEAEDWLMEARCLSA